MNKEDLKAWIEDKSIEWHWVKNDFGDEDVIIFPYSFQFESFSNLVKDYGYDDEGIPVRLKDGYFAVYLLDICESFDIELEEVFPKDKRYDE